MPTPLVAAAASCALAAVLHFWPRQPPAVRRAVSLAASAAGVVFLVAALRAEGLRASPTLARVVVSAPYVTETAAASASLYYYVLTAVCLLLGFAGLVAGDSLARFLAARPLQTALAAGGLVTALRFILEKSAAPSLLVQAVGISWMAPVVGVFFAASAERAQRRPLALARSLATYAWSIRGLVALVGVVATVFHLGTHYDVSPLTRIRTVFGEHRFEPGSARQIFWLTLVPQLTFWPVYTIVVGWIGAAVASWVLALRTPRPAPPSGVADRALRAKTEEP
jgi:hypothetical protein